MKLKDSLFFWKDKTEIPLARLTNKKREKMQSQQWGDNTVDSREKQTTMNN